MAESKESRSLGGDDGMELEESVDRESSHLTLDVEETRQSQDQDGRRPDHGDELEAEVQRLKVALREARARRSAEVADIESLQEELLRVDRRKASLRVATDQVRHEIEVEKENIANLKSEVEEERRACRNIEAQKNHFEERARRVEEEMARIKQKLSATKISANASSKPVGSTPQAPQRE